MPIDQPTTTRSESACFFKPRRLGHVNLFVSNVERSYEFYNTIVGLEESYVQPLNKAAFLGNNNTHHDVGLIDIHGPLGRGKVVGLNHLAFELENEVELVSGYADAVAAGTAIENTMDHDIAHSVYFRDPEDVKCEVYADVIKHWRTARVGVVTKPKSKWFPGMTIPTADRNYHVNPELSRVATAIFQPRRVVHAALVVHDMRRALDHYTRVVGLQPLIVSANAEFVVLGGSCGERNLSLFPVTSSREPGFHHAGFEMWNEDDLVTSIEKAKRVGLSVTADISHPTRRSVFIVDPDGFRIQFFVDRDTSPSLMSTIDGALALQLN